MLHERYEDHNSSEITKVVYSYGENSYYEGAADSGKIRFWMSGLC